MACGSKYVSETQNPPFPMRPRESLVRLAHLPFKPYGVGTSRKQIEVTEDCCPSVLVIQELIHENMD